jgi:hypothetical protein
MYDVTKSAPSPIVTAQMSAARAAAGQPGSRAIAICAGPAGDVAADASADGDGSCSRPAPIRG